MKEIREELQTVVLGSEEQGILRDEYRAHGEVLGDNQGYDSGAEDDQLKLEANVA